MRITSLCSSLLLLCSLSTAALAADAKTVIGEPAPAFESVDTKGQKVSLGTFKDKIVVLEWTNHECPYVKKHYGAGNMQSLQQATTGKGAVWISIISSAPDKEGFVTDAQANEIVAADKSHATHVIRDVDGKIGNLYGAKTTPHMFVIGKDGKLAYMGAIDDQANADPETIKGAKNYVTSAVDSLLAGKAVETTQTKPYGCGVKY